MSGKHVEERPERSTAYLWWTSAAMVIPSAVAVVAIGGAVAEASGEADVVGLPFERHTAMELALPTDSHTPSAYDPSRCVEGSVALGGNKVLVVDEGEQEIDPPSGALYPSRLLVQQIGERTVRLYRGTPEMHYRSNWWGLFRFNPVFGSGSDNPANRPIDVRLHPEETVVVESEGTSALELKSLPNGTIEFVVDCDYMPYADLALK
jgi:hypothetical protein